MLWDRFLGISRVVTPWQTYPFWCASGCLAGLVAITPGAGFVSILSAIAIGLLGGVICYLSVAVMKAKLGYDDSLDALVEQVADGWYLGSYCNWYLCFQRN